MAMHILEQYEPVGPVRAIIAHLQQLLHKHGESIELVPSFHGTFVIHNKPLTAEETRARKRQRAAMQKIARQERIRTLTEQHTSMPLAAPGEAQE
jgi:hypothetical protein